MASRYKILIVDDEEIVLDSCRTVLKGGEYEVATAQDGVSGLEMVRAFQPDLVFVDLKMPGMSGFEVLQEIQKVDPTIVTVVITGYATIGSAVEAMKQGAYDFVPKPFTPDEFRLITQRGLERRSLVLETMSLRQEKEMLREHFAAIVSHELKSPLGAVQQNLYALAAELSGKLTEEQQKRLERMQARVDDLLKLIHTWLKVISVDISKIRESFHVLCPLAPIAKATETVEPHARRKDIEIVTKIQEPLANINGDEGSLTQVLVNLLNNAVKYSHPGSRVSLKAESRDDTVMVSVSDTGIGISQEDLPYVFHDFYRGRSESAAESGSGLGLAISRRIVEAHGGTISVESAPGKGSTFTVCLPVRRESK